MTSGLVFDLQHFSVHDGPGIRTTVFLKGCPLRCTWCCNPESQAAHVELRHRLSRCSRCLSCVKACRAGGASAAVSADGAGKAPAFDREVCGRCAGMECVEACPEEALSVFGREMTVPEVVEEVRADEAFFRNSGGGVTFSGGEPLRQHAFLAEALASLRAAGIRTAVETCGCEAPDAVEKVAPLLDLVFFDLKLADPEEHAAHTGARNGGILENLARLARALPGRVVLRFPLVPGVTDDPENVARIAAIAAGHGIARASVVPYHPMGVPKYAELGRACPVEPRPVTAADLERVFSAFEAAGIACELA